MKQIMVIIMVFFKKKSPSEEQALPSFYSKLEKFAEKESETDLSGED